MTFWIRCKVYWEERLYTLLFLLIKCVAEEGLQAVIYYRRTDLNRIMGGHLWKNLWADSRKTYSGQGKC